MKTWKLVVAAAATTVLWTSSLSAASTPDAEGVFVGSSPCEETIRLAFRIPAEVQAELMQWRLSLLPDSRYTLQIEYGMTNPGYPGIAPKTLRRLDRRGDWSTAGAGGIVRLSGLPVSLLRLGPDLLQVRNPDQTLMAGNGGWSYTLNRLERAEKAVDLELVLSAPGVTYQIAPLSKGRNVYAVFEGRTPCQGIARELGIQDTVHPGCNKAKWRVTLYQDPETRAPSVYRVEGTLFRRAAREGAWSVKPDGANGAVYELAPGAGDASPLLLLREGDGNVWFVLDRNRNFLVGNAEFSYTLNRRKS